MYKSIQSFESVACRLELVILSRMFGITEHAQSNAVEYFNSFLKVLQDLHLHQVLSIRPQKPVIY